ncbi:MAG: hypothetical protein IK152_04315 [Lachnospiraceae bacterium]|nr:hypothetical protein [Lachnospiraceae bacterium]
MRRTTLKHSLYLLLFAAFCALFGAVYEAFSFGVYSNFMIYSFAVPLLFGILMLVLYIKKKDVPQNILHLLEMISVTSALGFIAKGVVDIYGSENRLLIVYPVLAGILVVITLVMLARGKKPTPETES